MVFENACMFTLLPGRPSIAGERRSGAGIPFFTAGASVDCMTHRTTPNERAAVVGLLLAATMLVVRPALAADEKPSATLALEAKSVAAGIGWTWGSGTLDYAGRKHHFKVEGLTVNAAGAERVDATGYVYNLNKLSNFPGTYTAVEASGAAGGGAGIATMRNEHGVRITLHSKSQGLSAQAGPEGMKITLQE
jgi:hypothetical protein